MLLVLPAVFLHIVLGKRPVGREDVLRLDVDMIQETLLQLVDAAVHVLGVQREIFVGVEDDHVPEAQPAGLVPTDKLLEDGGERRAGPYAHDELPPFLLPLLDVGFQLVGDVDGTLLDGREDVGRHFLEAGDLRTFDGGCRTVELLRYLVEYDL